MAWHGLNADRHTGCCKSASCGIHAAPSHAHVMERRVQVPGGSLDLLPHAPVLPLHLTPWLPCACAAPWQEPDDSLDLLRGATLIARHRHPLLRHEEVVEQLDDLAVQVSSHGSAHLGKASWMLDGRLGWRCPAPCTHAHAAVRVPFARHPPHGRRLRGACRGRPTRCACCRLLAGTCGTVASRATARTTTIQVGGRCLCAGQAMTVCWAGDACVLGRRCLCAEQAMPACALGVPSGVLAALLMGCPPASRGFTAYAQASLGNTRISHASQQRCSCSMCLWPCSADAAVATHTAARPCLCLGPCRNRAYPCAPIQQTTAASTWCWSGAPASPSLCP